MPTFDYTVELERSLLKVITASPIQARRYMHRIKPHFFTSNERQFIFEVLNDTLSNTGQMATRSIFEYEVGKRVEDNDQQYFIGEWNLVDAVDSKDPPEALIEKLEEANTGREILKLGSEVDALLEGGQIEDALAHLRRQSLSIGVTRDEKPLVELSDFHRREQTIRDKKDNPLKYRGLQTGFRFFDSCTGGLFPGELTLIAGLTGTGKSTLVRQIEMNVVILNAGKNVLHIANEEYLEQVEHKFDANFTEIPYLDFKRGEISEDDFERWRKFMQNWKHGRIFIKEVPAFTEVTLAEQAYRQCEARGIKIDLIIIDHLPHVKPIQKTWGENDEQKKAASDCKELARWLRVPVIVPTQAATEVMKKQEHGRRGNKLDVYGSKGQVHVANTFILITETGKDDAQIDLQEWERDVFWLCDIKKNRDGPPFYFRAKHRVKYGRIEEIGQGEIGTPKEEEPKRENPSLGKDDGVADSALAAEASQAVKDSDADARDQYADDGDRPGEDGAEKEEPNTVESDSGVSVAGGDKSMNPEPLPPPVAIGSTPMEHLLQTETIYSTIRKLRVKKAKSGSSLGI